MFPKVHILIYIPTGSAPHLEYSYCQIFNICQSGGGKILSHCGITLCFLK